MASTLFDTLLPVITQSMAQAGPAYMQGQVLGQDKALERQLMQAQIESQHAQHIPPQLRQLMAYLQLTPQQREAMKNDELAKIMFMGPQARYEMQTEGMQKKLEQQIKDLQAITEQKVKGMGQVTGAQVQGIEQKTGATVSGIKERSAAQAARIKALSDARAAGIKAQQAARGSVNPNQWKLYWDALKRMEDAVKNGQEPNEYDKQFVENTLKRIGSTPGQYGATALGDIFRRDTGEIKKQETPKKPSALQGLLDTGRELNVPGTGGVKASTAYQQALKDAQELILSKGVPFAQQALRDPQLSYAERQALQDALAEYVQ